MRILFIFLVSISVPIFGAPLDSCTRIDNCLECVNSTDGFGNRCEWCTSLNSCNSVEAAECQVDFKTLHQYNCPVDISNVKYDEVFMRQTVVPLIAATHSPDSNTLSEALGTCFGDEVEIINAYEVSCDETNITTCFGYTAYLKQHNAMVMVFRGTSTLFQFIDEGISFFLHKKVNFNVTKGVVDGYYLNAFNNIWLSGMQADFEQFYGKDKDANAKYWFFGHSLGGGLASIASAYVTKLYSLSKEQVKLITFGMPRIGDIDLAQAHDQLVPDSLRIEHAKDPIPALPPRTFPDSIDRGSFHHRFEIWYPNGMAVGAKYEIGSRPDTTVGRSLFPFNLEDHFKYFDVVLETWHEKGCKTETEKPRI